MRIPRAARKYSHREILRNNTDQADTIEELGRINLALVARDEKVRGIATEALKHRFSPRRWYKALKAIEGMPA